ncbi:MAG: pantoate--beta-alanine ligase [Tannerella sp.]|jgi:pantoate--beta-alanine ligase|nr:pantoate--beta-alanine ligase [Tannerella sp.]
MKVIKHTGELKKCLAEERQREKRIGFVPTMGALHEGHISLVRNCTAENDICIVSIFVNPAQFNDKNDLAMYPRTLEADCALLEPAGCDYVFTPSDREIYPEPDRRVFELGAVAEVMEGIFRPGHFNGVVQVVSKLFQIIEPDNAYFGEKDFQQLAVIKSMVNILNLPVRIVACPILREKDGLALSSRNMRLTPGQRRIAPVIAATLKESTNFAPRKSVEDVIIRVIEKLNKVPQLRVEYYEIVDAATLQSINSWEESDNPIGCIAVFCGEVRLIDNIKYETTVPETVQ